MQALAGIAGNRNAVNMSGPQPRMIQAAHEFEAQMMKELLKPLTSGAALGGQGADSDAGSGGALGEFAAESLGKALSAQGGFGIANRILADLSHSGQSPTTTPVTGNVHVDTGMRARK